jgi:hypothetical protein
MPDDDARACIACNMEIINCLRFKEKTTSDQVILPSRNNAVALTNFQ